MLLNQIHLVPNMDFRKQDQNSFLIGPAQKAWWIFLFPGFQEISIRGKAIILRVLERVSSPVYLNPLVKSSTATLDMGNLEYLASKQDLHKALNKILH
jgi:hypothetical protein